MTSRAAPDTWPSAHVDAMLHRPPHPSWLGGAMLMGQETELCSVHEDDLPRLVEEVPLDHWQGWAEEPSWLT